MVCECGGIFEVIRIEEYPEHLTKQERIVYDRVCDVECMKCRKVLFSQPYDYGRRLNETKKIEYK